MTIGNRLKAVLSDKGVTQEELAKGVGITQMAISNLINDKVSKPRNLLDIANFLNVDPNWLQDGVGEPNKEGQSTQAVSFVGKSAKKDSVVLSAYHRAACGDGYFNADYPDEIRSIEFSPEGFMAMFNRKSSASLQLVMVDGNSMYDPEYPDLSLKHGDLVCIDLSVVEMQSDGIYAFNFEGVDKIKRLQRLSGHRLKIISDNPKYEDEVIEGEQMNEMRIIGKLVKKMTMTTIDL